MSESSVQWPSKGYDPEGADLSKPTQQLLVDLKLLPDPESKEKVGWIAGTPESLQVMTAGATSISKLVIGAVGSLGGLGALATGLNGFFVGVGPDNLDTPLVRTAFILGGALIAGAVAISLAIVARSDVTARAQATAAQFEARAKVASAVLDSYVTPPLAAKQETSYAVQTNGDSWHVVEEFRWQDNTIVAVIDGDIKPVSEWSALLSLASLP